MTTLQALADARKEILKAEMAALLHNLGKLDVNFIGEAASGSASADIQQHHSEISNYVFKRFAAPDPEMFIPEMSGIFRAHWNDKQTFRQSVAALPLWSEAEQQNLQALIADFDTHSKNHPFIVREVDDSLRELSRFSDSNGPLYSCRAVERAQEHQLLQQIEQEITDLNNKLRQPDTPDKPALGRKLQELKAQKQSVQNKLNNIYAIEKREQSSFEQQLQGITIELGDEIWSFANLLTLFWDEFFYKPGDADYQRVSTLRRWLKPQYATRIPALLILSHGEISGTEKDKSTGGESGTWGHLMLTTAFGFEHRSPALWDMAEHRRKVVDAALSTGSNLMEGRSSFVSTAQKYLKDALSDTQWPWNEITLWNYASSIAALFKSCASSIVLNRAIPSVADARWRLLSVSFDGLSFWSQSHHVPDMLARRNALQKGLEAVRDLLEVEYPLGNEVYRDEHGSVFIVADYDQLLTLQDSSGTSLEHLLRNKFDGAGISGELTPEIKVSAPYQGKQIELADILTNRYGTRNLDAQQAMTWWTEQRPDNAPICTVCGVRPIGYPTQGSQAEQSLGLNPWATQEKATQRNICRVCLDRREWRAEDWAKNKDDAFERTIWIDEIADNNGRFALVVGRFVLDGWLNGRLIPTLQKSPSFARIQRCWETTHTFWDDVQRKTIPETLHSSKRLRLKIQPVNATELKKSLGGYHTYELVVRGLRMGVCWDTDRGVFWTTANLHYCAKLLGIERKRCQQEDQLLALFEQEIIKGTLNIYESGGYLELEQEKTPAAEGCQVVGNDPFSPFIPVVTEPAIFMALVPADRALDVLQGIKEKYDSEMARVRDRLPLHVGIIFATRRTPIQTVLDAGKRMLKMPSGWESWNVCPQPHRYVYFERHDCAFDWKYPEQMGDGSTPDKWYCNLLITDPTNEPALYPSFVSVDDLQPRQTVYIRPSRFDFEFLDTTARRFHIAYDENGRRLNQPTRPFLLDDLGRLNTIWHHMQHLKPAQRHQIIHTIEATRELWYGADKTDDHWTDQTFRKMIVENTLAGAEWPRSHPWCKIDARSKDLLIEAGVRGELADLAELHHHILKEEG
ncbi:MAG: hypothetical protein HC884_05280 [Chloroflexaceae bacterium]|nr:hypothetical protein [Chloroflexaceae bacterium]